MSIKLMLLNPLLYSAIVYSFRKKVMFSGVWFRFFLYNTNMIMISCLVSGNINELCPKTTNRVLPTYIFLLIPFRYKAK